MMMIDYYYFYLRTQTQNTQSFCEMDVFPMCAFLIGNFSLKGDGNAPTLTAYHFVLFL